MRAAAPLLLGLLALLAWAPTLWRSGFSYDDHEILESPCVRGELPLACAFDRDYWHHRGDAGHWRPAAVLLLRADAAVWGERAAGFHLTNVLLHALVVLLAAYLLRRLAAGQGDAAAWAIGLALFAIHPALADSVAWVSGRTSMACAAGGLLGALLVERAARSKRAATTAAAAGLGLALALCGKEEGLAFAPLYLWLGLRVSRRQALAAAAGSAVAVGLWLLARQAALGALLPSAPHAPLADTELTTRLAVGGRVALEALRLAVFPFEYVPAAPPELAHEPGGILAAGGWLVLLAALLPATLAAVRGREVRPLAASAFCSAVALVPFLQIVPSGELWAPRFLYLPLLFAAPFVGALAARLPARALTPVGFLLLALLVAQAYRNAAVYASRASYRERLLSVDPSDAPSWNDLGIAREEEGDLAGAMDAWRRATTLDPRYSRPWTNLGRGYEQSDEPDSAEEAYMRAVVLGPRNAIAHCNMGSFLLRRAETGDLLLAQTVYQRATEIAPGLAAAWRGLGNTHVRRGDHARARSALARCLELAPGDERAQALLERASR